MIKLGKAEELEDGSLLLKPPFNPLAPEKQVFHDGTGGGWWNTKLSAGFAVKQFDRTEWPLATAQETPQTNGWPIRMTHQHRDLA
jgi:hypothetical protein